MGSDGVRQERAAQNELVFRTVNEQIVEISGRFSSLLSDIDVVCECANASGVGTIRLGLSEFAEIRHSQADFIVLPGHVRDDIEDVVVHRDGYVVVRKDAAVVEKVAQG
jgi:hypothetical protein